MAIITISRGSYSKGKEIAEKVAGRLGYECFSRDLLLEASEEFRIPEVKLVRALHDAPSILERFTHGRQKYVAFIQQAFLEHVERDDVVYHGLAGHFFLRDVGHVLKVRIIADPGDRVRLEMEREGLTEEKARRLLEEDDEERRRWSQSLYGIDTADAGLYDLVLHIRKLRVDDAVDLICDAAGRPAFRTTDESRRKLADLLLAARIKAAIVRSWPNLEVSAKDGVVTVSASAPLRAESRVVEQVEALVRRSGVPVKDLLVDVRPTVF